MHTRNEEEARMKTRRTGRAGVALDTGAAQRRTAPTLAARRDAT